MNPCIKTGARVHVLDYDGLAPADLFLVGNAVLVRFGVGQRTTLRYGKDVLEHATHTLTIGHAGIWREDLGIAVVPLAQLTGEVCHPRTGLAVQARALAAALAPPKVTCPTCDGAGEITLAHPSGNPELEEPRRCPDCLGEGELEVDAQILERLECLVHQRDRAERALASVLHAHPELRDVLAPVHAAFQEKL